MEVRLRDLLLDIEDRIHQGTLGTLKVYNTRAGEHGDTTGNLTLTCLSLCVCSGDGQTGVALSAGSRKLRAAVL